VLNGIPEPVRIIWQALNQASPTFLVGGAVRDWLLHERPHDYDFASALPPGDVAQWAKLQGWQAIPTGVDFGTVTLRHPSYQDWPVEVTTFRKDGRYKDGRHPAEVHFSDRIEDDLSRRDFTVNAMALRLTDGGARPAAMPELLDPYRGLAELAAKRQRPPRGPPRGFRPRRPT
jgi:tRNA nucleotidyltransferase (CCA-adding enzyme)